MFCFIFSELNSDSDRKKLNMLDFILIKKDIVTRFANVDNQITSITDIKFSTNSDSITVTLPNGNSTTIYSVLNDNDRAEEMIADFLVTNGKFVDDNISLI